MATQPGQAEARWINAKTHGFSNRERKAALQGQVLGQVGDLRTHGTGQLARLAEGVAQDPHAAGAIKK